MSKKENSNQDIDLMKYQDQSGVSLKEMNIGLWLSDNRKKILKVITIFLIILCAFFLIYSSYNYIAYFLAGDPNQQISTTDISQSPRNLTKNLEVSSIQVFSSNSRYDIAAKLKNPNSKFIAIFKYCFTELDKDSICGENFIFPNEEKYILALGQGLQGSISDVSFELENVFWQRINAHDIPDWTAYEAGRLNFIVSDLSFSSLNSQDYAGAGGYNFLKFSIKNQTPYSYYQAPLNILLFSGSELIGVNRYLLNNFLSGENREVKISWPGSLPGVSRTEIKPEVNINDEAVYLRYQGEASN